MTTMTSIFTSESYYFHCMSADALCDLRVEIFGDSCFFTNSETGEIFAISDPVSYTLFAGEIPTCTQYGPFETRQEAEAVAVRLFREVFGVDPERTQVATDW